MLLQGVESALQQRIIDSPLSIPTSRIELISELDQEVVLDAQGRGRTPHVYITYLRGDIESGLVKREFAITCVAENARDYRLNGNRIHPGIYSMLEVIQSLFHEQRVAGISWSVVRDRKLNLDTNRTLFARYIVLRSAPMTLPAEIDLSTLDDFERYSAVHRIADGNEPQAEDLLELET